MDQSAAVSPCGLIGLTEQNCGISGRALQLQNVKNQDSKSMGLNRPNEGGIAIVRMYWVEGVLRHVLSSLFRFQSVFLNEVVP